MLALRPGPFFVFLPAPATRFALRFAPVPWAGDLAFFRPPPVAAPCVGGFLFAAFFWALFAGRASVAGGFALLLRRPFARSLLSPPVWPRMSVRPCCVGGGTTRGAVPGGVPR